MSKMTSLPDNMTNVRVRMLQVKIKFRWNFFNLGWFPISFVS